MHIGAYARHATEAAIELSIGLEEALMANFERKVKDVMVNAPIAAGQDWPSFHGVMSACAGPDYGKPMVADLAQL